MTEKLHVTIHAFSGAAHGAVALVGWFSWEGAIDHNQRAVSDAGGTANLPYCNIEFMW